MFFESFRAIKAAAKLYKFIEKWSKHYPYSKTARKIWRSEERRSLLSFLKRVSSQDTRKHPIDLDGMLVKYENTTVTILDAIEAAIVLGKYLVNQAGFETIRNRESEDLRLIVAFWINAMLDYEMMSNSAYVFKASVNSRSLKLRCAIMEIIVHLTGRRKHYQIIDKHFAEHLKEKLLDLNEKIQNDEGGSDGWGSEDEKQFKQSLIKLVKIGFRLPKIAKRLENSTIKACGLLLTYLENNHTKFGKKLKLSLDHYKSILESGEWEFISDKHNDSDVDEYDRDSEDSDSDSSSRGDSNDDEDDSIGGDSNDDDGGGDNDDDDDGDSDDDDDDDEVEEKQRRGQKRNRSSHTSSSGSSQEARRKAERLALTRQE